MQTLRLIALYHMLAFSPSTFTNPFTGDVTYVRMNRDWGTNVCADVWTYPKGCKYREQHEEWVVGRGLRECAR